jgi:hypothetical protein
MISSNDAAMASGKLGIGAMLVVLGVAGMAYAMPIESNSLAVGGNSPMIYDKVTHPPPSSSMVPYLGIVAASAASFVLGIAFLTVGQMGFFKPIVPKYKARVEKEDETTQSSPKHADAA